MTKILIGCDPEMFVRNATGFVSAHGLIPGTKENPHKVEGGAIQVDGMAVEFNIDPASNMREFVANITKVRGQLISMLQGYEVVPVPLARFTPDYMKGQPAEALELGCDPDYNAYSGEANPRPNGDVPFRTAGGHVHIGWTEDAPIDHPEHVEACRMFSRELDFYLGIPSLFWDEDQGRRQMYGNPGAFRAKSYGVEYRSLSNAWLSNEDVMKFVYKQTKKAFENLANGTSLYQIWGELAITCMQNNDKTLAKEFFRHEERLLAGQHDLFSRIVGE